jgi:hypothetical protein
MSDSCGALRYRTVYTLDKPISKFLNYQLKTPNINFYFSAVISSVTLWTKCHHIIDICRSIIFIRNDMMSMRVLRKATAYLTFLSVSLLDFFLYFDMLAGSSLTCYFICPLCVFDFSPQMFLGLHLK